MIGSVVSEEFYHVYSSTTTSISCLSNILLIYVLSITHIPQIGPYRILLLIFAVTDVLVSLIHLMLIPAVHMTEFGYIFWGYRFINASTTVGTWAGLIMVILFYQTFVLLAFHYVFRYVKLCNPAWLSWIGQKPWRNWLVIGIVSDVAFVGSIFLACFYGYVPTELSRNAYAPVIRNVYGIDLLTANEPGYLGIVYWIRNNNGEKEWSLFALFIISCVILPFFATGVIIVLSTVKIVRELSAGRFVAQAAATKRLQQQLFKTLIVQTIVPVITAYVPLGMIFLVPLSGFAMEGLGTVCMMSTALFPMLDPFIVIFLITGYRKTLLRILRDIWAYIVANVASRNALGKWAIKSTVAATQPPILQPRSCFPFPHSFPHNSERRSGSSGRKISAMIPQNRANPTLHCSKEIKFCFIFCVIIVLQVTYLHFALHKTTATITHKHRFDPRRHVYLPNATFEQILSETSISEAAQSLPSNGTLFCFVLTSPKYHRTRVPAVASTWLRRCDHGQFYTSAPIPDYEHITQNRVQAVSVAYSTIFKRIPDEYELLFSKTLLALRFTHRMYPEFDWYYKADDDTYAIVEHLRQFLSTLDPSLSHYIGYRLNKHIPHGYHSGGAGYVLSRAALEAFERADLYGDRKRCPPCQYEDVGLGRCLANLTIFPKDAKNGKGQHLFFPSRPDQIIRWKGADTISRNTISFHHLSPQEMLDLELFTYYIDSPAR